MIVLAFGCGRIGFEARARSGAPDASAAGDVPVSGQDAAQGSDGLPSNDAAGDGGQPAFARVTSTLELATIAEELSVASAGSRLGIAYSDGSDRRLLELDSSGRPLLAPTRLGAAVEANELVLASADVGYLGAFSNHRVLGQWQVYVTGVGVDARPAIDGRVSQGAGEAMAPTIQRAGERWALSWRDGQRLGFALVGADGVVSLTPAVDSLRVFPLPDRILVSANGYHVLIHGDDERAIEHFTPAGVHSRRGEPFAASAADADFVDGAVGVLFAQADQLQLRRFHAQTDVATGPATCLHTAVAPIVTVRMVAGPEATGLLWIAQGRTSSLWFSTLQAADALWAPIPLSAAGSNVSEARLAATDAGFVAVWVETSASPMLRAASITR